MIKNMIIWLRKIGILPKLKSKRTPKIKHDPRVKEEFLRTVHDNIPKEKIMNFTTNVKSNMLNVEKDHPSYPSSEYEYDFSDCVIKWTMSIEARSWGIKSIYPYVRDAEISVEIRKWTDDEDEYIETIEINESDGWEMHNQFGDSGGGLAPNDIFVDFVKKKVTVEF
tara:strand:- start:2850 stop:3350 length:501 start_codon:yes stop_codon:yes gene_type:complete